MITSRHDKINRLFDNEMDLNEVTVFDELFSNHDSDVNRNGKKSKFRRCNFEKSDIKSLIRHAFISENEECIDNIFEDKCIYLNKKSERDNFENDAKYQKPLKLIEKIELDDDCKYYKMNMSLFDPHKMPKFRNLFFNSRILPAGRPSNYKR